MTINNLRLDRLFPLAAAITLCAFSGCASTTVLQSQPPGARVSINGAVVGTTPYSMTDTKIIGSTTPVHLELPGYAPLDVIVSRNEQVDVLALIGGLFLLFPFLWVMDYQPTHMYQLQPAGPVAAGYYQLPPGEAPPPPPQGPAGYPPPPPGYAPPAGYPAPK